jgi:hypothetical protein
MNTNIRNIGGAIGTAVVTGSAGSGGFPTAAGYTTGFAVLAVTGAVAVVFSLLIPARRPQKSAAVGSPT